MSITQFQRQFFNLTALVCNHSTAPPCQETGCFCTKSTILTPCLKSCCCSWVLWTQQDITCWSQSSLVNCSVQEHMVNGGTAPEVSFTWANFYRFILFATEGILHLDSLETAVNSTINVSLTSAWLSKPELTMWTILHFSHTTAIITLIFSISPEMNLHRKHAAMAAEARLKSGHTFSNGKKSWMICNKDNVAPGGEDGWSLCILKYRQLQISCPWALWKIQQLGCVVCFCSL